MKNAKLYKITHIPTGLLYYGSIWAKEKTIQDRLIEHLEGKGGKFIAHLLSTGALKKDFITELVMEGELSYICNMESEFAKNTLWPNGLNGNAGKNIVRSEEGQKVVSAAVSKSKLGKTKETCDGVARQAKIASGQQGENRTDKQKEWDSKKSDWALENNVKPPELEVGSKKMTNGLVDTFVPPGMIDQYIRDGWKFGSSKPNGNTGRKIPNMKKREIVKCPHCPKIGNVSQMKRWHYDNCKNK